MLFNNYAFIAVLIFVPRILSKSATIYQKNQQMISRITRSRDKRGSSNAQHHGVSDPVPVTLGREIKSAVLLQVVKQIESEMKKANEQGKAI